jgi:hypothetical protein
LGERDVPSIDEGQRSRHVRRPPSARVRVFAPDEGTHFVSRLWSRSGLRVLSILVLVFGLVGGGYLSADRQTQQRATAAGNQARMDLAYQQQLQQQQVAMYAAGAPARAALAAAQAAAAKKAKAAAAAAAKKAKAAEDAARKAHDATSSRSSTRTPSFGPIPKSCSAYTGNRAIGCTRLLKVGFGLDQMPCLDKMWTKESNWRTTAENSSSGSYGIPQAYPASSMLKFGTDYKTNPVTQIDWGLDYIKRRYKTPCGAWTFWQGHNWY